MINKRSNVKKYEIVPIGLDLLCDWLCDFMTLQLLFLLDTSSDEHITFEIMVLLLEKKLFKSSKKLKRKPGVYVN